MLVPNQNVTQFLNNTHEEIGEYLYEQGVSSNSIETLIKEFDELTRIAKWYSNKTAPSEFETVAYLGSTEY